MTTDLLFVAAGYLLGSIPTGILFGKVTGIDPREVGSQNMGASNVARAMGKKWGLFTLIIDVSKALIPTLVAAEYASKDVAMMTGAAATVGHCFPVWLAFKGGKGVATAFGAMAAILPIVAVISAIVWFTIVFFTRTPALGSLAAAALFVALPQIDSQPAEIHFFTIGLSTLLVLRHGRNMRVLKARWQKKNSKPKMRRKRRR